MDRRGSRSPGCSRRCSEKSPSRWASSIIPRGARRGPGRRRGPAGGIRRRGGVGRLEALRRGSAGAARIEARSGVGEFILDFSGTPRGTTELEVHGGVGRVLLTVPSGLGVRVRASKGLTKSLRLEGFKRVGDDEYVNDTWATATAKLDVRASLGIGEFAVLVK